MKKKAFLVIVTLLVLTGCVKTKPWYENESTFNYFGADLEFTPLNISSDSSSNYFIDVYDSCDGLLYYGEKTLTHSAEFGSFYRLDKINIYDLEDENIVDQFIPNEDFIRVKSIEKVNGITYAIVITSTENDVNDRMQPYQLKVIKDWRSEQEEVIDEYDLWHLNFTSEFAKLGNDIYYLKTDVNGLINFMRIRDGELEIIKNDFDVNLKPSSAIHLLSNGKTISFTLNIENYDKTTERYHYTSYLYYHDKDGKLQIASKDESYLFSALPIGDRYLVDELQGEDSDLYYWFIPKTNEFKLVDLPKSFGFQRRKFIDERTLLAINESFQIVLFQVDEDYNIEMEIIGDYESVISSAQEIFLVNENSFVLNGVFGSGEEELMLVEMVDQTLEE